MRDDAGSSAASISGDAQLRPQLRRVVQPRAKELYCEFIGRLQTQHVTLENLVRILKFSDTRTHLLNLCIEFDSSLE